ncbi:MAG: alpha/beta hydrolase [Clostridia bacterium]|nr:alpha/beta hydrolase [Clostridia bacterium]
MILLIVVITLLIAFAAVLFSVYHMAFYTNRKIHPAADEMPQGEQYVPYVQRLAGSVRKLEKLPFEPVEIVSFDGLKLFGRWYDAGKNAPVAIMFHGYRGSALRDSSGGAPFCIGRGFSVLLVDQRCHGKSEGITITFGIRERRDCLSWVNYVIDRVGENARIMLMGVSMGAATVMMAADLGLPEQVRAIAADCGYSSPEEIISRVAVRMGFPQKPAAFLARLSARVFGRFDLHESDALRAAKYFSVPVMLIHGDADRMVPCEMSRAVHAANPEMCTLIEVQGAGHGIAYYVDTDTYEHAAGIICDIAAGK